MPFVRTNYTTATTIILYLAAYPLFTYFAGTGQAILIATAGLATVYVMQGKFSPRSYTVNQLIIFLALIIYITMNYNIITGTGIPKSIIKIIIFTYISFIFSTIISNYKNILNIGYYIAYISFFAVFIYLYVIYGSTRAATYYLNTGSISNFYPAVIFPLTPLAIVLMTSRHSIKILFLLSFFAFSILSESRFSIAATILIIIYYAGESRKKSMLLKVISISIASVILYNLINNIWPSDYIDTIVSRMYRVSIFSSMLDFFGFENVNTYDNYNEAVRDIYVKLSMNIWKNNPVFGAGYNYMTINELVVIPNIEHIIIPHNIYITNGLAELGLIGLLFILVYTFYPMYITLKCWLFFRNRDPHSARIYFALLFGMLLAALHAYLRPQWDNPSYFLIFFLAAAFARPRRVSEKKQISSLTQPRFDY